MDTAGIERSCLLHRQRLSADPARGCIPIDNLGKFDLMKSMITRRSLVLTSLLIATEAPLARAEPVASDDPVAIVTAIYTRAAKGKGDSGGAFVIENKAAKAKYRSKSLARAVRQGGRAYPKGRRRPGRFRPRHQFAGAGCQILQRGDRKTRCH
jgi:hypothetical protein